MNPSAKQRVLEEKSGVRVTQWMPFGWSLCANSDDLRILVEAHIDLAGAKGAESTEQLLSVHLEKK